MHVLCKHFTTLQHLMRFFRLFCHLFGQMYLKHKWRIDVLMVSCICLLGSSSWITVMWVISIYSYSHFKSGTWSGFNWSFAALPNFLKSGIFSTVSCTGLVFFRYDTCCFCFFTFWTSQQHLRFSQEFDNSVLTLVFWLKSFSCVISYWNQIAWFKN